MFGSSLIPALLFPYKFLPSEKVCTRKVMTGPWFALADAAELRRRNIAYFGKKGRIGFGGAVYVLT
jgi:hypothetical protein